MALISYSSSNSVFKPKVIHYQSNGSGRDSYVLENNQGLISKSPSYVSYGDRKLSPGKFFVPASSKEPSKINYRGDGSGRDSYVILNSGGLMNQYSNPNFGNLLRKYDVIPRPHIDNSRNYNDYQNWYHPMNYKHLKKNNQTQLEMVQRLSDRTYRSLRGKRNSEYQQTQSYINESGLQTKILKKNDYSQTNLRVKGLLENSPISQREEQQQHAKSRSISPIKLNKVTEFNETRRSSNNSQLIINTLRKLKMQAEDSNEFTNDYTQPSSYKQKHIMLRKLYNKNNKTFDEKLTQNDETNRSKSYVKLPSVSHKVTFL